MSDSIKNLTLVIIIITLVAIVVFCESILEPGTQSHQVLVSVGHYLSYSSFSIIIDIIITVLLYTRYILLNKKAEELYFAFAFLINAIYLSAIVLAALNNFPTISSDTEWNINNRNTYNIYCLRQLNFIILTISSVTILQRIRNSCKTPLMLYSPLFFAVAMCLGTVLILLGNSKELFVPENVFVWLKYSIYVLTCLWFIVFLIIIDNKKLNVECRELLLFFTLSHVISNFIMAMTETANITPWYVSRSIDAFCVTITCLMLLRQVTIEIVTQTNMLHLDPVTGVHSRSFLFQDISSAAYPTNKVFIICTINNLHDINATHGYAFGDYILRHIASILSMHADKKDIVARFSGASFVMSIQLTTSEDDIVTVYRRIRTNIYYSIKRIDVSFDLNVTYKYFKETEKPEEILTKLDLCKKKIK